MRTVYIPKDTKTGERMNDKARELEPVASGVVRSWALMQWSEQYVSEAMDRDGAIEFEYLGGVLRYIQTDGE